jgi:hypothetical protein
VGNTPNIATFAFCLHLIPKIENADIDLYKNDVLHNFVIWETQLMNGTIPWKGSREKDLFFLHMPLEGNSLHIDTN